MAKKQTIRATVFRGLEFDARAFDKTVSDDNQRGLAKLFQKRSEFTTSHTELNELGILFSMRPHWKNSDENSLVYKVIETEKGKYDIITGRFAGWLCVDDIDLTITTKYGFGIMRRMLCKTSHLFIKEDLTKGGKSEKDTFVLLLYYLFASAIKNAYSFGLPLSYQKKVQYGYNVRGNVNITKYLTEGIHNGNTLTSVYRENTYVQDIIDLLYYAMREVRKVVDFDSCRRIEKDLRCLFSGRSLSRLSFMQLENHKALRNPMFMGYKNAIKYAQMILLNQGVFKHPNGNGQTLQGILFDITELWEDYLSALLSEYFEPDWNVFSQNPIEIYPNSFFRRTYYPDIIMRDSSGRIAVLDAKFKRMYFRNGDIDREDLHQIHSYAGYYAIGTDNDGDSLVLCSLVYPYSAKQNNAVPESIVFPLYGKDALKKPGFVISYLDVTDDDWEKINVMGLNDYEKEFCERLQHCIESL